MSKRARTIAFTVSKSELSLLRDACLFGADAAEKIEQAVLKENVCHLEFSYEDLDDVAGCVASCANHETSKRTRAQWDALGKKLKTLLKLSDQMSRRAQAAAVQQRPCGLKYLIFTVWLEDAPKGRISRKIQIADTKSLYNFAKVITQAFGFFFDHCFGFYDHFEHYHDSKKAFELFADIGEEPLSPTTKGVKRTQLRSVFRRPGETMLFMFDYGDGWRFSVQLEEIRTAEQRDLKPVILERIGEAPLQYPPADD